MARNPTPDVTEAEKRLLDLIWKHGTRTVRQLVDVCYPAGTPSDLATVQKLIKRMEDKGVLSRDRTVSPQTVSAVQTPGEMFCNAIERECRRFGMSPENIKLQSRQDGAIPKLCSLIEIPSL